jgi:leucyl/phenylalanyl-tRNA---protein transferase
MNVECDTFARSKCNNYRFVFFNCIVSMYELTQKLWFPPVEEATVDGLVALGGDLSIERLLLAYRSGIFPWYDGDVPLWWCPDPRFVLFPNELKISKSMQQVMRKQSFDFVFNQHFEQVMRQCMQIKREHEDGTWINEDLIKSFVQLHKQGMAICAEAWQNGELVGGLYGMRLGNVFFGESMFAHVSNASKFAFILLVKQLQQQGVVLIDCQVHTEHLESLGARMIVRKDFLDILKKEV